MQTPEEALLIRYGEIGLKGGDPFGIDVEVATHTGQRGHDLRRMVGVVVDTHKEV